MATGYKEFHDYLSAAEPSEKAFREAVEQMKLGTRRYAKRQVAWIRNKLVPAVNATNTASRREKGTTPVHMYLLDATGKMCICQRQTEADNVSYQELGSAWKTNVHDAAGRITEGSCPLCVGDSTLNGRCTLQRFWKEMRSRIL